LRRRKTEDEKMEIKHRTEIHSKKISLREKEKWKRKELW
jgi:hypothetical protein